MHSQVHDLDIGQLPRTPFLALESQAPPALAGLTPFRHVSVSSSDVTPRKRLVKDVLRTGRWKVGIDEETKQPSFWQVDSQTLRDLARNFAACRANGVQINLCWGHGPSGKIGVDARDLISPIDQVFASGDRLWVTSYVTPQQAIDLQNPAYQTSIRALENFQDGAGNHYALALLHVAIVDHPVVDHQGPFLDMANYILSLTNPPDSGTPTMDESMVELWQRAFALLGLTLPDDIDTSAFPGVIDALLSTAETQQNDAETTTAPQGATPSSTTTPDDGTNPYALTGSEKPTEMSNSLSAMLKPMADQIRDLSNTVSSLLSDKSRAAKTAYETQVGELLSAGHIKPARRQHYLELGAEHAYDLSILSPLEDVRVIDLGSRVKHGAKPHPPQNDAGSATTFTKPRQEDLAEGITLLGGRPAAR